VRDDPLIILQGLVCERGAVGGQVHVVFPLSSTKANIACNTSSFQIKYMMRVAVSLPTDFASSGPSISAFDVLNGRYISFAPASKLGYGTESWLMAEDHDSAQSWKELLLDLKRRGLAMAYDVRNMSVDQFMKILPREFR
jgi:hypothetical protein